ncbi:MAG: right-handed parallel beta-helix repeat-containing protein [Anaerolineales bacterium]
MKRIQIIIFTGIIFLSLVFPLNAKADDVVPPIATEEPAIVDVDPLAQTPPEQVSVSETLSQIPANTELIITNEDGSEEPLATQAAVDAVVAGDPIWCPEGATPQAGVGGCTDPGAGNSNYDPTSLDSLLNYLQSNQPSQPGVIWIEKNYDSSVNDPASSGFSIDGASFTTMKNYALTIQGAWSGIDGNAGIDHTSQSVFNGAYLHVNNWSGDVTINDVLITGVFPSDIALNVETTGVISVNQVDVSSNGDDGAVLDNSNGSGNIKINASKFDSNQGTGLQANSAGTISVENSSASNNQTIGAYLNNNFNSSVAGVTISGKNVFSGNDAFGLVVISNGNIALRSVTASGNGTPSQPYDGVLLDTLANILICQGSFVGNFGYGFEASLPGTLTLSNVQFSGNSSGNYQAFGGGTVLDDASLCPVFHEYRKRFTDIPLNIVSVDHGEDTVLDCESFSGTTLMLSDQNKVTFLCPITGLGSLKTLKNSDLSGAFPEGVDYVSGMQASQSPGGSDTALGGAVIISFLIPEELKSADLAILYFDGGNWVDLENANFKDGRNVINGGYFTGDGYFEAITNFSGSFILVKK